jgi:hypothetical protein
MVDSLKEFFKKAPGELGAIVIIMCVDLIFIYGIIDLSINYKGPLDLGFIIGFAQLMVFIALIGLFRVAHHRILSEEQLKLRSPFSKEPQSLPPNEEINKP